MNRAGTVMVWFRGTYRPEDTQDVAVSLRKGQLRFKLKGPEARRRRGTRADRWSVLAMK